MEHFTIDDVIRMEMMCKWKNNSVLNFICKCGSKPASREKCKGEWVLHFYRSQIFLGSDGATPPAWGGGSQPKCSDDNRDQCCLHSQTRMLLFLWTAPPTTGAFLSPCPPPKYLAGSPLPVCQSKSGSPTGSCRGCSPSPLQVHPTLALLFPCCACWEIKMVEVGKAFCTCSASKLEALQLSFLYSLGVFCPADSEPPPVQHL